MSTSAVDLSNESKVREVPKMHRKRWTKDEDEQLRKRIAEGLTITQLAKEHQRTSIAVKLRVLKFVLAEIKEGILTPEQAAKRYPVSPEDVTMFQEQEDTRKANTQKKKELKQAIKTLSDTELLQKYSEDEIKLFKSKEEARKLKQKSKRNEKRKGVGRWSKEDEEYLLANVSKGVFSPTIQEKLGRGRRACEAHLKLLLKKKIMKGEMNVQQVEDKYGYDFSYLFEDDEFSEDKDNLDDEFDKLLNFSERKHKDLYQVLKLISDKYFALINNHIKENPDEKPENFNHKEKELLISLKEKLEEY